VKLWLSDEFIIDTSLKPHEVAALIGDETRELLTGFPRLPVKTFDGTVTESGFRLRCVPPFRSLSLPVVVGRVVPRLSGSTIFARTRLAPADIVSWCAWYAFIIISATVLLPAISHGGDWAPWFGMELFVLGLGVGGHWVRALYFWSEVTRTEVALRGLLAPGSKSESLQALAAG